MKHFSSFLSEHVQLPWYQYLKTKLKFTPQINFPGKIHLVTKNIFLFDASSRYVMEMVHALEHLQIPCLAYADGCESVHRPYLLERHLLPSTFDLEKDLLIYHFSIGDELLEVLKDLPMKKIAYYHGITPPELLDQYIPECANQCRQGLEQLGLLHQFPLIIANSEFNLRQVYDQRPSHLHSETWEHFQQRSGVLPPFLTMEKWEELPSDSTCSSREKEDEFYPFLNDGRKNFLYVGRRFPHKNLEKALDFFHGYLKLDKAARLIFAGSDTIPDYRSFLENKIHSLFPEHQALPLQEKKVLFLDHPNDWQLKALYQRSHILINFSLHEGFAIPLVEAMKFQLPILSHSLGAMPETLKNAGIMEEEESPLLVSSALNKIFEVLHNQETRKNILDQQNQVYQRYYHEDILIKNFYQAVGPFLIT